MNTLIMILVALVVVGVVLWALSVVTFIDPQIKQIIRVVTVVFAVLWVLYELGFLPRSCARATDHVHTQTVLVLARAMVGEGGFTGDKDHVAIAFVLKKRWQLTHHQRLTFLRFIELYCASIYGGHPSSRQRWVRALSLDGAKPEGWPRTASWEKARERWRLVLQRSQDFFEGRLADPCAGRADHFGGSMDRVPRHWRQVDCGQTRNRFYSL